MKGGALLTTGEKTTFEKEGGAWSRSGSSSEPDELISITDLFRPVTQLITLRIKDPKRGAIYRSI